MTIVEKLFFARVFFSDFPKNGNVFKISLKFLNRIQIHLSLGTHASEPMIINDDLLKEKKMVVVPWYEKNLYVNSFSQYSNNKKKIIQPFDLFSYFWSKKKITADEELFLLILINLCKQKRISLGHHLYVPLSLAFKISITYDVCYSFNENGRAVPEINGHISANRLCSLFSP